MERKLSLMRYGGAWLDICMIGEGRRGGGESVPIYSFHCLISDGTILIGSNIKGNNLTMDPARQVLTFFFAIANLLNILYCPTFLLFVHHFKRAEVGIDQRKRFKDLYFFLVETCCFYSFFFCISILPTWRLVPRQCDCPMLWPLVSVQWLVVRFLALIEALLFQDPDSPLFQVSSMEYFW